MITEKIIISEVFNMDCMEYMKSIPDKFFELAIVDPPYGIDHARKAGEMAGQQYGKAAAKKKDYAIKDWDKQIPDKRYFEELKRVSKDQIIWGGNYMANFLENKSGWIVWDKDNGDNNFSDCELAWSSFDKGLRKFTSTWNGMIQHNMKEKQERIHPTEKPIRLYKWLLLNYAKEGFKILDTHLGSGSHAIAVHNMNTQHGMNLSLTATEIDKDYYEASLKRLANHQKQLKLI